MKYSFFSRKKELVKKINHRIQSVEFQSKAPCITRPFQNLKDFTGEEMLAFMSLAPLIFHNIINLDIYCLICEVAKGFLSLIYQVNQNNVGAWGNEFRDLAKRIHQKFGWKVSLNWHLVTDFFFLSKIWAKFRRGFRKERKNLDHSLGRRDGNHRISSWLLGVGHGKDE